MSKPNWKDAPDWAEWLAQDEDGEWCWYRGRPYHGQALNIWTEDEYQNAIKGEPNPNWRETLERRPQSQGRSSTIKEYRENEMVASVDENGDVHLHQYEATVVITPAQLIRLGMWASDLGDVANE